MKPPRRAWGYPYPPSSPKQPPPEGGIKMKKSGTTWWGQRWVDALEAVSPEYARRLARGKTYARAGRTHDLEVRAGLVTARVTGSRPEPYRVSIRLDRFGDDAWRKAIAAMAEKAQFAAVLLAGEMPREIDVAFRAAGLSLFPAQETDLRTECNCPDWANPCKHVAATHYVLGEAFDGDPFLLFELRGRTQEEVLAALREARGGGEAGAPPRGKVAAPEEPALLSMKEVSRERYDAWAAEPPRLHLRLEPAAAECALLRALGAPAGWTGDTLPSELLGPLLRAASARALKMAVTGAEESAAPTRR
jgi:uncharacterized Zn finger protein